jgi:hypothetical protein
VPDLPTLTVTDSQADRILAAFDDQGAYLAWLRKQLVEYVVNVELSRMQADALEQQRQAVTVLRAELDTTTQEATS